MPMGLASLSVVGCGEPLPTESVRDPMAELERKLAANELQGARSFCSEDARRPPAERIWGNDPKAFQNCVASKISVSQMRSEEAAARVRARGAAVARDVEQLNREACGIDSSLTRCR